MCSPQECGVIIFNDGKVAWRREARRKADVSPSAAELAARCCCFVVVFFNVLLPVMLSAIETGLRSSRGAKGGIIDTMLCSSRQASDSSFTAKREEIGSFVDGEGESGVFRIVFYAHLKTAVHSSVIIRPPYKTDVGL